MRYREDQDINNIQYDGMTEGVSDITVAYTLLLGFVFIALGRFGKQRWLIFWGVITVIAVLIYTLIRLTGWAVST